MPPLRVNVIFNHGLSRVLLPRGKPEHAMQLTTTAFKRAAQRLAAAQSQPLSTIQEQLAQAFGFRSLDALLHKLRSDESSPSQPEPASPQAQPFCCGLSYESFSLLLHCLRRRNLPGDSASWHEKGLRMLTAVLSFLRSKGECNLTAAQLAAHTTLAGIESLYLEAASKAQGDSATWPLRQRALGRYLESGLPAYKVQKLIAGQPQDSMANEQHGYRQSQVAPYLDTLMAIEQLGGPSFVKVLDSSRERLTTLWSALDEIVEQQALPTAERANEICLAAHMAIEEDIFSAAIRHTPSFEGATA